MGEEFRFPCRKAPLLNVAADPVLRSAPSLLRGAPQNEPGRRRSRSTGIVRCTVESEQALQQEMAIFNVIVDTIIPAVDPELLFIDGFEAGDSANWRFSSGSS